MNPDLSNQVALVTGAGRGIGRHVALALAGAGAQVVAAARTRSQIDAVRKEIEDAGGRALAVPVDLAREEDIRGLFSEVRQQAGGLDVLVNNGGIGLFGQVQEFSTADLDRLLAVNLRGTFLCCREAMKIMAPRKRGCIINIASVVGIKGYPNQAGYTASKHGVMGLTKSLAVEAQSTA